MLDESAGYSDLNTSGSSVGRKRSTDDDGSEFISPPKRGRPPGRARGRGSRGGRGNRGRGRGGVSGISGRAGSVSVGSYGELEGDDDDFGLYSQVKNCVTGTRLRHVVDQWIKEYEENRDNALVQVVQFFFASSGCGGSVDTGSVLAGDYTQLIRRMTEEFDEDSGEYPLIMTGQSWKRFRQNFCEFIQILVKQCQYNIIYDQVLMDNMISLLTALADSQVRAFRHTATLAAMKLMSALVDVVNQLRQSLDHITRQHDAESAKARPQNDRLRALEKKKTDLNENMEEVNNMIGYMFKSVFVHRYRDVWPDIRTICIAELGNWIMTYPAMFLEDSYLKYIGWTLSDKVGDVRMKCLMTLLSLYGDEDFHQRLELFTNKFKDRFISMALDKEPDVAVIAVKLVISILKYFPNVLSDRDCESIYELVYASHRGLAVAAGEFLNVRLFRADPKAVLGLRTRKGKARLVNTPLIRDLILFFIEGELHQHGAYVIDALIDSNEMVKDWECMTDLLLEEPGENEEALDDRQESVLIELMVCAIKQAATGEPPVGRALHRKYATQKEQKHVYDEKAKISKHFMEILPLLLQKYAADGEKVKNLLQIPLYFDLEMYSSMRLEKHLDALLKSTEEVLDKHTDDEVLQTCSKVYECLCSGEVPAIQARCDTAKSKVIDGIVMRLRNNWKQFTEETEELDEEDMAAIMVGMKKVHNFYQSHDLSKWELWDLLLSIVKSEDPVHSIPPEILIRAIQCCYFACLWDLKHAQDTGSDKENTLNLKKRVDEFIRALDEKIRARTAEPENVLETAFLSACDLYIAFGWPLGERQPKLQPLVVEMRERMDTQLLTFVQDVVFVEAEEEELDEHQQIELLHKRRNLLSAFCKLVIYGVVRMQVAAGIFQYYLKFYQDYGDIIKTTLGKCRENNRITCAQSMACSLSGLFAALKDESDNGRIDRHSDGFLSLRELARKFGLSFGADNLRSRDAIAAMHKEGVDYALHTDRHTREIRSAPPNLAFLEALTELSNKLVPQDKKAMLNYLNKQLPDNFNPRGDEWQPLAAYRTSLSSEEMPPPPAPGPAGVTPARRGRGRPPRNATADLTSGFAPATTSTAVKRPRLETDQLSDAGSDFRDAGSRASFMD